MINSYESELSEKSKQQRAMSNEVKANELRVMSDEP
jgi:hypothetical protein